jgi:hypothetical protein
MPPAAFLVFGPGDPGRIPGGSGSENGGWRISGGERRLFRFGARWADHGIDQRNKRQAQVPGRKLIELDGYLLFNH